MGFSGLLPAGDVAKILNLVGVVASPLKLSDGTKEVGSAEQHTKVLLLLLSESTVDVGDGFAASLGGAALRSSFGARTAFKLFTRNTGGVSFENIRGVIGDSVIDLVVVGVLLLPPPLLVVFVSVATVIDFIMLLPLLDMVQNLNTVINSQSEKEISCALMNYL